MTDNRTTELLPCPFCNSKYTQVRWIGFKDKSNGAFESGYRGECTECFALTRAFSTESEAIAAWNARAELGSDDRYDAGFESGVQAVFQQLEGIEDYEGLQDLIAEYWYEGEGNDER